MPGVQHLQCPKVLLNKAQGACNTGYDLYVTTGVNPVCVQDQLGTGSFMLNLHLPLRIQGVPNFRTPVQYLVGLHAKHHCLRCMPVQGLLGLVSA